MMIATNILTAQQLHVFEEWAQDEGVQEFFYRNVTKTDGDRNVYVAGATLNQNGDYDLLITKYDRNGDFLWKDTIAGPGGGHDFATDLVIDGEGNVVVCGSISQGGAQGQNMLVVKYDPDGFEYWRYSHDYDNNNDAAASVCVNSSNRIFVTGATQAPAGFADILTINLNSDGTFAWEQAYDHDNLHDIGVKIIPSGGDVIVTGIGQIGATQWRVLALKYSQGFGTFGGVQSSGGSTVAFEEVRDMVIDDSGNIYLVGSTLSLTNGMDVMLIKLDDELNIEWTQTWDGSGQADHGYGVRVAPNGDVYVCGSTRTTTQGDDALLLKYNASGSLVWSQTYNGSHNGDDTAESMEWHPDGYLYLTGSSYVVSNLDYLTLKYDTTGALLWEITYNSPSNKNDRATNMAIDDDGDIIVSGQCEINDSTTTYYTVKYVERIVTNPTSEISFQSSKYFTPNVGQIRRTDGTLAEEVVFISRNDYPGVFVQNDKLSYVFLSPDTSSVDSLRTDTLYRVDMVLNDDNKDQKIYPLERLDYFENFYLGYMEQMRERIHPGNRLVSFDVWRDTDLFLSNHNSGLVQTFVCKPGFNAEDIRWTYEGADTVIVQNNELLIYSPLGVIQFNQPYAWQLDATGNEIPISWQPEYIVENGKVSFVLESFNSNYPLVISVEKVNGSVSSSSEVPEWATYYGGNNQDAARDIANNGEMYGVAGGTRSSVFPIIGDLIFDSDFNGDEDAFVAMFYMDNTNFWTTYMGGDEQDRANGITMNQENAFVCGIASRNNIGVFSHAFNNSSGSFVSSYTFSDGFIAGFNVQTGARTWSTYFGDFGLEPKAIALDASNNIYVTGNAFYSSVVSNCESTESAGYSICNPGNGAFVQPFHAGGGFFAFDGFIAKFSAATELVWSTLFGGSGDEWFKDLAIDDSNNKLYIVGGTTSPRIGSPSCDISFATPTSFPLCDDNGYFQTNINGNNVVGSDDGFILRFSTDGQLEWSTYFGGIGSDIATGVDVGDDGNVFITGITTTQNYSSSSCEAPNDLGFPSCATGSSYSEPYGGGASDAFIARFNTNTDLVWSSYFGGGARELLSIGGGPKVKAYQSSIYLGGSTESGANFWNPIPTTFNSDYYNQSEHSGESSLGYTPDCFVSKFDGLNELVWSTYYGGSGGINEFGNLSIADNKVIIVGQTSSANLPVNCDSESNQYCSTVFTANHDAFIAQLKNDVSASIFSNYESFNLKLTCFPNPATDVVNVVIPDELVRNDSSIRLLNVVGMTLMEQNLLNLSHSGTITLNTSDLPRGVYIISLNSGQSLVSGKFTKM